MRGRLHGPPPVLDVRDLCVAYRHADGDGRGWSRTLHDISFQVGKSGITALLGESGSGKSTIAKSIIGLLPAAAKLERGVVALSGEDIAGLPSRRLDDIRGRRIGFVPQDPSNSLNPVRTIGAQVGEMFRLHSRLGRAAIRDRAIGLLDRVGLTRPAQRFSQYPHELSGGMRQRVLIAMAIALNPELIIADEPTSALDVTVQRQILDLLDGLCAEYGTSILLVTHDLAVAQDRSQHAIVLRAGRIEEQGETAAVFGTPRASYTKRLLSDRPRFVAPTFRRVLPKPDAPDAIVVGNLVHDYALSGSGAHRAVDGISFTVRAGTTHAIVGESGSGKTTVLRCLMGLIAPTAGTILIDGQDVARVRGRREFRRQIQLVYQNPYGSLDPKQDVRSIVEEPLLNLGGLNRQERRRRVGAMLDRVQLPHALLDRRPGMMSGGQCQRVALARALVMEPRILVLDEVVSALDVSVQAQILRLLAELQAELGLTYVFVSHDLAVVRQIADSLSVLYHGKQVECGPAEAIFTAPADDYTRLLIDAIPGNGNAYEDCPA